MVAALCCRRSKSALALVAVLALALPACGASRPDARRVAPAPTTSAVLAAPPNPAADTSNLLWLQTRSGVSVIDRRDGGTRLSVEGAVAAPDWSALAVARLSPNGDAQTTRLAVVDPTTGVESAAQTVSGGWVLRTVAPGGRWLALTGAPSRLGSSPHTTDLAIVSGAARGVVDPRTFHLDGNFAPDGFSSDGTGLFVIEYLPTDRPDHYRVLRLDTTTGSLSDVFTRDKEPPEEMSGTGRTQVFSPRDGVLYTLYTEAGGEEGHAFVHTLSVRDGWVFCIDLPPELGFRATGSESTGSIAVSRSGDEVFVAGPAGRVAVIDTEALAVRRTVDLGTTTSGSRVAPLVAPSHDGAWISVGRDAFRVLRGSADKVRAFALPDLPTAMVESRDGTLVLAAQGRLLELSATTGDVVGDHPLTVDAASIQSLRAG